jgi:hypothetical protein
MFRKKQKSNRETEERVHEKRIQEWRKAQRKERERENCTASHRHMHARAQPASVFASAIACPTVVLV